MIVRAILVFILLSVIARLLWRFIEAVVRGATAPGSESGRKGSMQPGVKMAPCPVCGTYVVPGKAISAGSGSGLIYFCSDKCRAEYVPR